MYNGGLPKTNGAAGPRPSSVPPARSAPAVPMRPPSTFSTATGELEKARVEGRRTEGFRSMGGLGNIGGGYSSSSDSDFDFHSSCSSCSSSDAECDGSIYTGTSDSCR